MIAENIWKFRGRKKHRQIRRAETTSVLLNAKGRDMMLDVGCGGGFVSRYLVHNTSLFVGIDAEPTSLHIAKNKTVVSKVEFIRASATDLPFKDHSFDKTAMLEVLEHLPKEAQRKVCNEVDRILKEEGIIVISVPYREQITYIHCDKLASLWGHLHSMDEENVTNLLPSHYALVARCHLPNVELISIAGIFEHLPLRLWLLLNNFLGKFRKGYWLLLKYKKT